MTRSNAIVWIDEGSIGDGAIDSIITFNAIGTGLDEPDDGMGE